MAVSKGKSKEWKKKCVQLLCVDVVMVIFVYQGGKKKKAYFLYVLRTHTMGAIFLCKQVCQES